MNQRPFKILGIDHVGIAVKSLDGLSDIFDDIFGLERSSTEIIHDQNVITDIYYTGNSNLEFLSPTDIHSPISKFINKKGPGMHHISLIVDDLQAALSYLEERNIHLIDTAPRIGAEGNKIAFIHPKSTGGVLLELCEKNDNTV